MRTVNFNGNEYEVVKGKMVYLGNTILFETDGRMNIILPINIEDGEDSIAETLGGCEIVVATQEDVYGEEMYYDEDTYSYRINGIKVIPAIVLDKDIHNTNREKEIKAAVNSVAGKEHTYSHSYVNMSHTIKNVYIHFDRFVEMSINHEYETFVRGVKNVLGENVNIIPTKNVNCSIHAPSFFVKLILSIWGSKVPDDIEVGYDETEHIPRLVLTCELSTELKHSIQTVFNSVGILTEFKSKSPVYIDVVIDEKVEVFRRGEFSVDKKYLENKDYKNFIKEYVAGNIPIKPGTDVEYTYVYDTVSEPKSHTLVSVGDDIILEEVQVHAPHTIKLVVCESISRNGDVIKIIRAGGNKTETAWTKKTAGALADMVVEHIQPLSSTTIEIEAFYVTKHPDKIFYGYVIC